MPRSTDSQRVTKLLGSLPFVRRTFEGNFTDTPFALDMDANLYIGPADHLDRGMHSAVEVVYHFLSETGAIGVAVREILRNRALLLDAFDAFDAARVDGGAREFRIVMHGTYDGEPLSGAGDDDLPAGPCGVPVNQVKLRFYRACRRLDSEFLSRKLSERQKRAEARLLASAYNRDDR